MKKLSYLYDPHKFLRRCPRWHTVSDHWRWVNGVLILSIKVACLRCWQVKSPHILENQVSWFISGLQIQVMNCYTRRQDISLNPKVTLLSQNLSEKNQKWCAICIRPKTDINRNAYVSHSSFGNDGHLGNLHPVPQEIQWWLSLQSLTL